MLEVHILGNQQGLTRHQEGEDDHHEDEGRAELVVHARHGVACHGGDENLDAGDRQGIADGGHDGGIARKRDGGSDAEGVNGELLGDPDDVGITQLLGRGEHRGHQLEEGVQNHEAQAQDQDEGDEPHGEAADLLLGHVEVLLVGELDLLLDLVQRRRSRHCPTVGHEDGHAVCIGQRHGTLRGDGRGSAGLLDCRGDVSALRLTCHCRTPPFGTAAGPGPGTAER